MNKTIHVDVLAICAHPDDAELHCGGLLLKAKADGALTGVLDLTRGEAASRGTVEIRASEAQAGAKVLGLSYRDNLGFPDAQLTLDKAYIQTLVTRIRALKPAVVVTSHWDDHHPDHQATAMMVREACYLAGIGNYQAAGAPHRPEQVMFYLDRIGHTPQLVLDISAVFEQKLAAVKCYASQLYDDLSKQEQTPLSGANFLTQWQSRHSYFGSQIGVAYGEGYVLRSPVPVKSALDLLWGRQGVV